MEVLKTQDALNLKTRFRFHTAAMKQRKRCSTAAEKIPYHDGTCRPGVLGAGPIILLRRGDSIAHIAAKLAEANARRPIQSGSDLEEMVMKKIKPAPPQTSVLGAGPVTILRRGESITSVAAKIGESNPSRPISDSVAPPQAGVLGAGPVTILRRGESNPSRPISDSVAAPQAGVLGAKPVTRIGEAKPKRAMQSRFERREIAPKKVRQAVDMFAGTTFETSPSPQCLPLPRFLVKKQLVVN